MDAGSYKINEYFGLSWEQRQPDYFYNGILCYCCMKLLKYEKYHDESIHLENITFRKTYICLVWVGVCEWMSTCTYICTWVCMFVEARGWYQLWSSVHVHFIFLHLGFSLNQLNRADRKPSDLPVSVSAVLGLQMHHCPWLFTRMLQSELRLPCFCNKLSTSKGRLSGHRHMLISGIDYSGDFIGNIPNISHLLDFFVMSPLVGKTSHSLCQKHLAAGHSVLKHKMPYIWMTKGEVWSLYLEKVSNKASRSIYFNIPSGDLER